MSKIFVVKEDPDSNIKYTETQIVLMLDFSIDNILIECGGHMFQQTVDIAIGTNCAPLFLYSYEVEIIQNISKSDKKKTYKQLYH